MWGTLGNLPNLNFLVKDLSRNRPFQNTFFLVWAGPKASTKLQDESRRWR